MQGHVIYGAVCGEARQRKSTNMKLHASDPDVETIIGRIQDEDIDLQPDFQRGAVWNQSKRQLLIDTILRDWHVPPVHVVRQKENTFDEVLDGQQRLAAIYSFYNDEFPVDGTIEPADDLIRSVHGKYFSELPQQLSKLFRRFSIRVITISDFRPEEPGELFFRLNHQVTLTPAEARNAFFGPVREQVKSIARQFERWGLTKETLGFSNARMAHDDVVARVMMVLDWGSIAEKVTANKLADRYRSRSRFPESVEVTTSLAFETLGSAVSTAQSRMHLNKATLWSWVLFIAAYHRISGVTDAHVLGRYLEWLEDSRTSMKGLGREFNGEQAANIALFNDRASSRVADVSSVVIRDLVVWALMEYAPMKQELIRDSKDLAERVRQANGHLHWLWDHHFGEEATDVSLESAMVEQALHDSWGRL